MAVDKDADKIRRMFSAISPRYDLLNHVLSLNRDRVWRRRTVRALELSPESRVLDVCCGTADLAIEMAQQLDENVGQVVGSDFSDEMVRIAERKTRSLRHLEVLVADTLRLPFPSESFDVATVAFGIRNVCDLGKAVDEMYRVLRPGGKMAILEFSTPRWKILRSMYQLYFHSVLPRIGAWISRSQAGEQAYSYLPQSVAEFPTPGQLSETLREHGFEQVSYRFFTCGIAALHIAHRPDSPTGLDSRPQRSRPKEAYQQ